jgi:mRNA interferase MazF
MIELTPDQRQELNGPEPVAIDPQTKETYVLVRSNTRSATRPARRSARPWSSRRTRNAGLQETIVVLITKNTQHVASHPQLNLVDVMTPDGKASELNLTSAVKCGKLFTVHETLVRRKIGVLSAALMQKLNACLKAALELP